MSPEGPGAREAVHPEPAACPLSGKAQPRLATVPRLAPGFKVEPGPGSVLGASESTGTEAVATAGGIKVKAEAGKRDSMKTRLMREEGPGDAASA